MQFKCSFLLLACGAFLPLASSVMAQSSTPAPNVSWGATLTSGNYWTGWAPHDSRANLVDPALVVGTDRLVTAVESQMNQFNDPWHGDDHVGNNSFAFNEVLGPALPAPQDGYITSTPQLLLDLPDPPSGVATQDHQQHPPTFGRRTGWFHPFPRRTLSQRSHRLRARMGGAHRHSYVLWLDVLRDAKVS